MSCRVASAGLLLTLLASSGEAQSLDTLSLEAQNAFPANLRWSVVDSAPRQVSGKRARTWRHEGDGRYWLRPGDEVSVYLADGESLDVHSQRGRLEKEDLELWLSDGSELRLRVEWNRGKAGDSQWYRALSGDSIATLRRPAALRSGLGIDISVGRQEGLSNPFPYRKLRRLPGASFDVRRDGDAVGRSFGELLRGQTVDITVEGVARFRVETHLRYGEEDTASAREYAIRIETDSGRRETLEFRTVFESSSVLRVDGQATALGKARRSVLEVLPGEHRVQLSCDADVLVRILAQEEEPLLFPDANRGVDLRHRSQASRVDLRRSIRSNGAWFHSPELSHSTLSSLESLERRAYEISTDNGLFEGGIAAWNVLRHQAAIRFYDGDVRTAAAKMLSRCTEWVDLTLIDGGATIRSSELSFATPVLRMPENKAALRVFRRTDLERRDRSIESAVFHSAPGGRSPQWTFDLPEREAPSRLRFLVECPGDRTVRELEVEFDSGMRHVLRLGEGHPVPAEYLAPDSGQVLRLLSQTPEHAQFDPFLSRRLTSPWRPLHRVASALVDVPASVSTLRLRGLSAGEPVATCPWPRVTVQVRMSKSYTLREQQYLGLVDQVGGSDAAFEVFLDRLRERDGQRLPRSSPEGELENHWHRLLERLRADAAGYVEGIEAPPRHVDGRVDSVESHLDAGRARYLQQLGDRFEALSIWNQLRRRGSGDVEAEALVETVSLLDDLGETNLAEKLLRGSWLLAREPTTRQRAMVELERRYVRREEGQRLRSYLAARLARNGDRGVLLPLARVFASQDEERLGLQCLLLVPEEQWSSSELLSIVSRRRWTRTFERMLDSRPADGQVEYWSAVRDVNLSHPGHVLERLSAAGPAGSAQAASLREALRIVAEAESPDVERRLQAFFDLEEWWTRHPGDRVWRSFDDSIDESSGERLIYRRRDGDYRKVHVADPDRPARLSMLGPARLRIACRLLHSSDDSVQDDWILVDTPGGRRCVPVSDDRPSLEYSLESEDELPGKNVSFEIEVRRGHQEVRIAGLRSRLLFRVQTEVPTLDLVELPRPGPELLSRLLWGPSNLSIEDSVPASWRVGELEWLDDEETLLRVEVECDRGRRSVPRDGDSADAISSDGVAASTSAMAAGLSPLTAARVLLRRPWENVGSRASAWTIVNATEQVGDSERLAALARLGELENVREQAGRYGISRPAKGIEPLLRGGESRVILRALESIDRPVRIEDVEAALWVAEISPELRPRAQAIGQDLIERAEDLADRRGLLRRLTRGLSWRPVADVRDCAGLREISQRGWRPEGQSLRVRRALLGRLADNERVLVRGQLLRIEFDLSVDKRIRIGLRSLGLVFDGNPTQTIATRLDGIDQDAVALTSALGACHVEWSLAAGPHVLELWNLDPIVERFVTVALYEQSLTEERSPDARDEASWKPIEPSYVRRHFVGTAERPVRIESSVPAFFRVEWQGSAGSRTTYHFTSARRDEVVLKPLPEEDEVLLRIFQQVPAPGESSVTAQLDPVDAVRRPSALEAFEGASHTRFGLASDLPAELELGLWPSARRGLDELESTLSLETQFMRRRSIEEDPDGQLTPDVFFEVGLVRRQRLEELESWFGVRGLGRVRSVGGPTVGIESWWRWDPSDAQDLSLDGRVTAYAHWPGAVGLDTGGEFAGSIAGSLRLQQVQSFHPLWYNLPALSIKLRHVSLDRAKSRAFPIVDEDVYTRHKERHRYGWTVADTIVYKPWLDAQAWARLSLSSNEDLDPFAVDNFGLQLGWRQQVADLGLSARYQLKQFFADDDRSRDALRHYLSFRGTYDVWMNRNQRLEVRAEYFWDVHRFDSTFFVALVWHVGGTDRGLTDFMSSEVAFEDLRSQRFQLLGR